MPIGGEGHYPGSEYPFQIKIPEDVKQAEQKLEGKVETEVAALKTISCIVSHVD